MDPYNVSVTFTRAHCAAIELWQFIWRPRTFSGIGRVEICRAATDLRSANLRKDYSVVDAAPPPPNHQVTPPTRRLFWWVSSRRTLPILPHAFSFPHFILLVYGGFWNIGLSSTHADKTYISIMLYGVLPCLSSNPGSEWCGVACCTHRTMRRSCHTPCMKTGGTLRHTHHFHLHFWHMGTANYPPNMIRTPTQWVPCVGIVRVSHRRRHASLFSAHLL